jgi:hypothetical protein
MSFEKKLYDYEANPPQKVWDKLSVTLDDLQFNDTFKKKLESITTQLPVNGWEKIKETLNSEIADTVPEKLYNLTEAPPAEIWNRIDEQLAENDFNKKFAEHLNALEVTPPVGNWRKIAAGIGKETPVVNFRKAYYKPLRYAAAAVVIGLIAWAGLTFFNSSDHSSVAGTTTRKNTAQQISEKPVQNPANNLQPEDPAVTVESDQLTDVTLKKQKSNPVHKTAKDPYLLTASTNQVLDNHSGSEEIIADASLLQSNKKAELNNAAGGDDTPRYLVYLNDKGSMMKISKKLADLTCIYTKDGEVSQDALAKLDRVICNDMVLCWQEKLALAPINFSFNPLEMADILK